VENVTPDFIYHVMPIVRLALLHSIIPLNGSDGACAMVINGFKLELPNGTGDVDNISGTGYGRIVVGQFNGNKL